LRLAELGPKCWTPTQHSPRAASLTPAAGRQKAALHELNEEQTQEKTQEQSQGQTQEHGPFVPQGKQE